MELDKCLEFLSEGMLLEMWYAANNVGCGTDQEELGSTFHHKKIESRTL